MVNLKNQIKAELEQITDLKAVILEERHKKDPLDMDIPSYPVAFVGAGAITSNEYLDNVSFEATISHNVTVLMKAENYQSMTEVEALMFTIAKHFMRTEVLGGACQWIKPTTTEPVSYAHGNRQLIEFTINLEVRKLIFI